MKTLTNEDIEQKVKELAEKIKYTILMTDTCKIYGVPRGGIPVAYLLSKYIFDSCITDNPEEATIIVDDIKDSGDTRIRYVNDYNKPFFTLCTDNSEWIHFPWEAKDVGAPVMDNILRIEQFLDDAEDEEKESVFESLNNILKTYATR